MAGTYRVSYSPMYVFHFSFLVEADDEEQAVEAVPDWSIGEVVRRALEAAGASSVEFERILGDEEVVEDLNDGAAA